MFWPLLPFCTDFRIRFSKLLSDKFKKMDYKLAMRLALNLLLVHYILGGFDHYSHITRLSLVS